LWVSFKYERLSNLCYWCGSLTHDDRDCEMWIESEGTLPIETQQFGSWIRAPPFMPSRRHSISVPGFYKAKAAGLKTNPPARTSDKPPVVLRRGGPSPEIVRPEKENLNPTQNHNDDPDIQEQNQVESSPSHTAVGDLFALNTKNLGLDMRELSAELFEERIKEIDKDIARFDADTDLCSKNNSFTGKENNLESMTINEIFLANAQARAQPQKIHSRTPLSTLPDTANIPAKGLATWKRLARDVIGTDVVMSEAVGSKRATRHTGGQTELLKKKKVVSQNDKSHKQILAEAGSQPCQNQ